MKAHFVRLNARGRKAAALHLAYIERDGVTREGRPGELYGPSTGFDRDSLVAERPGEQRQFRFIVSPEDARELDLQMFTRALMAQMEADLGRQLVWGAVDHWDTDNPHTHVVVRGVDARGKDLKIDRDYITSGIRWRAQEIATRELGLRPEHSLVAQVDREISEDRLTSLDRRILPLVDDTGRLSLEVAAQAEMPVSLLAARLDTLSKLGLARRVSATEWMFVPGWAETLKTLGQRNDIIKRMYRGVPRGPHLRILEPAEEFSAFEGVVRRKGLHDEQTGELFALVETVRGDAHYVRLLDLAKFGLDGRATFDEHEPRFQVKAEGSTDTQRFHLEWQRAEALGDTFFRIDHPLAQELIEKAASRATSAGAVVFEYEPHASALERYRGTSGWLEVSKLSAEAVGRAEEFLLVAACDGEGKHLAPDVATKFFSLQGRVTSDPSEPGPGVLAQIRDELRAFRLEDLQTRNEEFFEEEVDKLERWAEDVKFALERELRELDTQIKAAKKTSRSAVALTEKLEGQKLIKSLETTRNAKRRRLFEAQDDVDRKRTELIGDIERQLQTKTSVEPVFTLRWTLAASSGGHE